MRPLIIALTFTACTTTMHFRVIEKGAYGAESAKASIHVSRSAELADESAIVLNLGRRATGGWSIEPIEVSGDQSLLTIKTKVNAPPAGSIVTEAITYPFVT